MHEYSYWVEQGDGPFKYVSSARTVTQSLERAATWNHARAFYRFRNGNTKHFFECPDDVPIITLYPLAMVRPTRECIYTISRLSPVVEIGHAEFLERYADQAQVILASFERDGVSNPQKVTAYGLYIIQ